MPNATLATQPDASLSDLIASKTEYKIFGPDSRIDRDYYRRVDEMLSRADSKEFATLLELHKSKILSAQFDVGSDKVFAGLLDGLASSCIEKGGRYKSPSEITKDDLEKLEVLRKTEGFDYWSKLKIGYTGSVQYRSDRGRGLQSFETPYEKPFALYLVDGKEDLTLAQLKGLRELVNRSSRGELLYALSSFSRDGYDHLGNRNMLHAILEGEITPSKRALADLLYEKDMGESSYRVFIYLQTWETNSGNVPRVPWHGSRYPLHSAVLSGRVENVAYALEKGERIFQGSEYGGNAFGEASRYSHLPQYREIARLLLKQAAKQDNGDKVIGQQYRTSTEEMYPIQHFANNGDLEMVLSLAAKNAGVPIWKAHADTHSDPIVLGGYYSGNGTWHPEVHTRRTKTEYFFTVEGHETVPSIKQAVFNLDPANGFYGASANVFDRAMEHLVKEGVLKEKNIPKSDSPDFIPFVLTIRAAAEAEKAQNSAFLQKTAEFTPGFTEQVRQVFKRNAEALKA